METSLRHELTPPVVNGLLVAAGYSSRMVDFKPLLLWEGKPFITHILRKMKFVCQQIVVVTGYREVELIAEVRKTDMNLDSVQFVTNPLFAQGMFTSLQTGLRALQSSDWVLYHFVDQPDIPEDLYPALTSKVTAESNWLQPRYQNRNGHPVLIGHSLFDGILNSDGDSDLRTVMKQQNVVKTYLDCSYPQILHDMDYPEDLSKLTNETNL